jgi:hypothetical protein
MAEASGPNRKGQLVVAAQLLFCVAGIYGAYLTQGVVQETLSTKKFGPDGLRFPHLSALNAVQSWACFLWAYLLLRLLGDKQCAPAQPSSAHRRAPSPPRPPSPPHSQVPAPLSAATSSARPGRPSPRPPQGGGVPARARVLEGCRDQLRWPSVRLPGAQVHLVPGPGPLGSIWGVGSLVSAN